MLSQMSWLVTSLQKQTNVLLLGIDTSVDAARTSACATSPTAVMLGGSSVGTKAPASALHSNLAPACESNPASGMRCPHITTRSHAKAPRLVRNPVTCLLPVASSTSLGGTVATTAIPTLRSSAAMAESPVSFEIITALVPG